MQTKLCTLKLNQHYCVASTPSSAGACFFVFLRKKKIGQSVGASRWRVCYQRGLPRLVSSCFFMTLILTWLGFISGFSLIISFISFFICQASSFDSSSACPWYCPRSWELFFGFNHLTITVVLGCWLGCGNNKQMREIPLVPMGVLTPRSAHARPSDRPPVDNSGNFSVHMSAEFTFKIFKKN